MAVGNRLVNKFWHLSEKVKSKMSNDPFSYFSMKVSADFQEHKYLTRQELRKHVNTSFYYTFEHFLRFTFIVAFIVV